VIAAIVLAAGESKRMGAKNKLLLPFGHKTLIEQTVDNVLSSKAQEVIVVLGHEAVKIKKVLQSRKVKFVENQNFKKGMSTSIQTGIKAVSSEMKGSMICLSDLPCIESMELNKLIDAFNEIRNQNEKVIVVPTYKGKRGNPVIFSSFYHSQILTHSESDGCKGVIKQNLEEVLEVKMSTAHILQDIDTKNEYENIIHDSKIMKS